MEKNNRILFYVDGSAVRKLEPELPQKQESRLPKPRKRREPVVFYDPLAMVSLAVTAMMLILMVAGFITLFQTYGEVTRMEQQVAQLRQENAQLQREYESGYDLEEIRQQSEALGLVPQSQVQTMTIEVEPPQPEVAEPTFWEQIGAFFAWLFA